MTATRRRLCRWLGWLALALCFWALLWAAAGDALAAVRFGLYLSPFVMGVAGLSALAALWLRMPSASLLSGGVALALLAAQPVALGRTAGEESGAAGRLTVTTLSNRTRNADMAATARAMRTHPADIFVLQEIADADRLLMELTGIYSPGERPHACARGTYVVLSRYPVGPPVRPTASTHLFCPVDLPAGRVWVGSVHLPRAVLDDAAQNDAVGRILGALGRLDDPVIMAGDFNATPLTTPIGRIGRILPNAYDRAGAGFGFTFPTRARRLGLLGAFLRIDHIFASPALAPEAAHVERWHPPEADHFPVTVTFSDQRAGGNGR